MSRLVRLALATLALSALPEVSAAQNSHTREGFWFNLGLGAGSLGCSDCDTRESGLSGGFALGGTVNQHWLLGVFSNAWTKSENGATLTASTLVAGFRYYPSADGGFFLLAGLGLGSVDLSVTGFGSISESGSGALLGLGWDIRVGKTVSLTPFWNGAGIAFSGGDANFGQLGVGFTIH
jgi:hypothetical protein